MLQVVSRSHTHNQSFPPFWRRETIRAKFRAMNRVTIRANIDRAVTWIFGLYICGKWIWRLGDESDVIIVVM